MNANYETTFHMQSYSLLEVTQRIRLITVCIYRFVMIRLDYYGTYGYCFYETCLVKHIPDMTSWCYVAMSHTVVDFHIKSFNSHCNGDYK